MAVAVLVFGILSIYIASFEPAVVARSRRLQPGMSIAQVEEIMGSDGERVLVQHDNGIVHTPFVVYGYKSGLANRLGDWIEQVTGANVWDVDVSCIVQIDFDGDGRVERIQRGPDVYRHH